MKDKHKCKTVEGRIMLANALITINYNSFLCCWQVDFDNEDVNINLFIKSCPYCQEILEIPKPNKEGIDEK